MSTEGGGRYTPPPRRGARRGGGDDQTSGSENDEDTYVEFSVENFTAPIHDGGTTDQVTAQEAGSISPITSSTPAVTSPGEVVEPVIPTSSLPGVEFCTPPSNVSDGSDEAPQRYRTVANTLATTMPILDFDYGDECMVAMEEPTSFTEAEKESCWRKAMIEEMNSIEIVMTGLLLIV
ncbi:hypothetical protein E2562_037598 [Oryza meyeriana var. granulata]|uniref:Uncharacterized protein n=1 Tax=Oryza meyeriana var. granulata TaxID=110450 RepID=A0A6G1CZ98_9ORYZ|nr:hypothetical protein E2562_037598 [Oryza meyeriana var. granulata]